MDNVSGEDLWSASIASAFWMLCPHFTSLFVTQISKFASPIMYRFARTIRADAMIITASRSQRVGQQLVHLGDLRWDAKVYSSIAHLHDETTFDLRINLGIVNGILSSIFETQTLGTTFNLLPWLYSDFVTALSNRCKVFVSSFYVYQHSFQVDECLSYSTDALVTIISISPLAAPINIANFSQTPCRILRRLFSARVCKKFLTVSPLSIPPVCFCNSWMICDLSAGVKAGAERMLDNLASFLNTSDKRERDFEVLSKADVLTAAVYW